MPDIVIPEDNDQAGQDKEAMQQELQSPQVRIRLQKLDKNDGGVDVADPDSESSPRSRNDTSYAIPPTPHSIESHKTSGNVGGSTTTAAKFAASGLSVLVPKVKQSKVVKKMKKCFPAPIRWPTLAVICGVVASLVTWLMWKNTKVSIPAWMVVGVVAASSVRLLQIIQLVIVYQVHNLGLDGTLQWMKKRLLHRTTFNKNARGRTPVVQKSDSDLNRAMYLSPLHSRAPRPEIEEHPFISKEGGKDWFRFMQKTMLDTLSSKDVAGCSTQQIQLLTPPLILCAEFEFARKNLGKRLAECNSLAVRAVCLVLSEDQMRGSKKRKKFLESVLSKQRLDCWSTFVQFYESCCTKNVPDVLMMNDLPNGLQSPFTGSSAPVESLLLEKRYSSGHGPTVVELRYQTNLTVEEHNLCKGDIVEAYIEDTWRHGTIMEVSKEAFNFRDSTDKEHFSVSPEHIRPWPRRLVLKPDTVVNDMTCFCMFRVFNYLWRHSFIPKAFKPCALDLEVLPAGHKFGFMEYVENSEPAANYDWDKLYKCDEKQLQVFLRTAAGSMIAGHVLGIGDRHQDNIMLREVELPNIGTCVQFFQLDFKHCLGMRTRIDTDAIAIPSKMKRVLEKMKVEQPSLEDGEEDSAQSSRAFDGLDNRFDELIAICSMAFRVLRRSSGFVMHFVRLLNRDPDLTTVWESHLMESLCFRMKEEEAIEYICDKVRNSANTMAKFVKDISHKKRNFAAKGTASETRDLQNWDGASFTTSMFQSE